MKGLILKDFYILKSAYRKNLPLVAIMYGVLAVSFNMSFFLYMMIVMSAFYTLSTFTLDDASKWDRYARTLPVSTNQIIGGKWVITLGFLFVSGVYSLIVGAVCSLIHGSSYLEILLGTGATLAVTLLIITLLLPIALKWGVDKARNSLALLFAILFVGCFAVGKFLAKGFLSNIYFTLPSISPSVVFFLAFWVLIALLFISYRVCCAIYAAKEF